MYTFEVFFLTVAHMQEVLGPAHRGGTTICFPERAYCDIFSKRVSKI